MSVEENAFLELVKDFSEISPEEADELLSQEKGTITFIGRPTCPYCRKFLPKLHKVSVEQSAKVYYVNSEHPEYNNELKVFRDKYDVPTVPGLLVATDTSEVKVRCDSSMSEEEITDFIKA